MREIKRGDIIVGICKHNIGRVEPALSNGPYDAFCLAPSPDPEFKEGDWVLPIKNELHIKSHEAVLLQPMRFYSAGRNGVYLVGSSSYWLDSEIVSITREGSCYVIGDSCKMSTNRFVERYGCDPIPESEPSKTPTVEYASDIVKYSDQGFKNVWEKQWGNLMEAYPGPGETDEKLICKGEVKPQWPTLKDIRECCGLWGSNFKIMKVSPEFLTAYYEDRDGFEAHLKKHGYKLQEPMPPQCLPGNENKPIFDSEWMKPAVRRYPSGSSYPSPVIEPKKGAGWFGDFPEVCASTRVSDKYKSRQTEWD